MKNNINYYRNPEGEDKSFSFYHVHICWNEQIALHQQKTWELSYVLTGKGMRMIGEAIEPFCAGEVILIPPEIPHYWSFDESESDTEGKIENITLTFSGDFLKSAQAAFAELVGPVDRIYEQVDAISFGGETLRRLRQVLSEMKTETTVERLSSLIRIVALISSPEISATVGHPVVEDRRTKRLQQVYLYVAHNFQHPITLEQIARHVGMERAAFCVFFKKMNGTSFFSFLADYRINVACTMLLKTNKTIAEVCIASGFRDIPYFNRVFKAIKQTTPSQFRAVMGHAR